MCVWHVVVRTHCVCAVHTYDRAHALRLLHIKFSSFYIQVAAKIQFSAFNWQCASIRSPHAVVLKVRRLTQTAKDFESLGAMCAHLLMDLMTGRHVAVRLCR